MYIGISAPFTNIYILLYYHVKKVIGNYATRLLGLSFWIKLLKTYEL